MKHTSTLFCILLFLMQTKGQQPDSWKQMQSLGGSATPRTGAVSFSVQGKGYMGLGSEGNFVIKGDFWEYDPSTNTWSQKADFPGGERTGAIGFYIGEKGYVGMGGAGPFDSKKDFWEYNPATNTWTRKANFASGGRTGAAAFSIGAKGYVGMGIQGFSNSKKDFWEYDPSTDTWTQKANFKGGKRVGAIAINIDSKGYVGMGVGDSSGYSIIMKDFWEYDPATDAWTQKADLKGGERTDAIAFSIGNRGYVGTGYNYTVGYLQDFWEYNPLKDHWIKKADFIGGIREGAIAFAIKGKGYIGTGDDGSFLKNDFWEYEKSTDTWVQKAGFAGAARSDATGFSIQGKGYIGTGVGNTGGSSSGSFKDFWEYDTLTKAWTQKADFGGGNRQNAVGFSIGNKGYIGTGSGDTYKKDFWEYDPILNTWTQKADFGGPARSTAVGFSVNDKGYIGTGYSPDKPNYYRKDFWEYDPATDTWTKRADFKGAARTAAVGFGIGNKGYVGTGVSNNKSFGTKDFWEYDTYADTWTRKKDFRGLERYNAVGFNINNKGYIGTGFAHDSLGYSFHTKDFWEYNPAADTWTQKADFGGTARSEATGIGIGNYGFIGFGTDFFSYFNDWWQYTPSNVNARQSKSLSDIAAGTQITGNKFLVYPNPVKNKLNISIDDSRKETVTMRILNMDGKQVYVKTFIPKAGKFNFNVDVTRFPAGIYTIQLISKERVKKANFIKE